MDPFDLDYRTNYDTHVTGVLLVPSEGLLQSKTKWHDDLAVPAGTLVDIPKNADFKPFVFRAPNGETTDAVRVTLASGTEAKVNACGNGHGPKGSMIVKLIDPLVETRYETRETAKVPDYTRDGLRRAEWLLNNEADEPEVQFTLAYLVPDICKGSFLRNAGCTIAAGTAAYFGGKKIYDYYNTPEPSTCTSCPR
jgi:hypothetical protein